jgi:hypothetical protein
MAARRFVQYQTLPPKLPKKDRRNTAYSMGYHTPVSAMLSKQDLHAYLHHAITQNIPYFKALTRYRNRRQTAPQSCRDAKNARVRNRLTESGLHLLKTQWAKKPKNPV